MKRILVASISLLMFSCSNGNGTKEEKKSDISSVVDNVSNLNKLSNSATKVEELTSKLKKLTPLTNDELKVAAPETWNGLKRKSFNAGNYGGTVGMSSIQAEYGDDAKSVKLMIMDGAGETASAIVSLMAMSLSMDTESESDGVKSKTVEIDGIRALTEERKVEQSVTSSIKYLYKERYSISLDGTGYTLSELEAFMKSLNTSSLK